MWGQRILVPKDPCPCWIIKLKLLLERYSFSLIPIEHPKINQSDLHIFTADHWVENGTDSNLTVEGYDVCDIRTKRRGW